MIDKIIEEFRHEFGDNQPDIEEFIRKEFEEQDKKYQNLTTSFNELAEIVKRLRLDEEEVLKVIESEEGDDDSMNRKLAKSICQLQAICQLQEGRRGR